MPKYMYKAINTSGSTQTGIIEANSERNAAELLHEKGFFPQKIAKHAEKEKKGEIEFSYKIKTPDLAVFCNQFAVVLKAGVSILQSLEILSQQTENKKLKGVLKDVYSKIQRGSPISGAFKDHSKRFPDLFISMLETGEASGNLDLVLERMGISLTKENKLTQKVKSAMIYPMILSIVALLVVIFLLVAVVPTFSSMYAASGQELPFLTKIMLWLGDFMSKNIIGLTVSMAIAIFVLRIILRIDSIKYKFDRMKLGIPIFGKLLLKIVTARYTQNMATLLSSGISLTQSLEITSKSVGNFYVSKKIYSLINEVRSGKGMGEPLERLGIFAPMVVQMTKLGEESGALDELLLQTSDFYEAEAEAATTKLTALIEPVIIVFMGGVVLMIVLSILLPMFGMYSMIG